MAESDNSIEERVKTKKEKKRCIQEEEIERETCFFTEKVAR